MEKRRKYRQKINRATPAIETKTENRISGMIGETALSSLDNISVLHMLGSVMGVSEYMRLSNSLSPMVKKEKKQADTPCF